MKFEDLATLLTPEKLPSLSGVERLAIDAGDRKCSLGSPQARSYVLRSRSCRSLPRGDEHARGFPARLVRVGIV